MNIRLGYLVAEITRRCNMKCEHCLRGNRQKLDMSFDIINRITSQVESVNGVTFTGGEPSLNSDAIRQFMYGFIYNRCPVDYFWVATNARFYKEDFINVLSSLYSVCNEQEYCVLTVSGDQYHYARSDKAYREYSQTPFFADDRMRNIPDYSVVNEGNAKRNRIGQKNISIDKEIKEYIVFNNTLYIDDVIYINALGDVILNCDLSYASQRNHSIGNVLNERLQDILINNLDKENEYYEEVIQYA